MAAEQALPAVASMEASSIGLSVVVDWRGKSPFGDSNMGRVPQASRSSWKRRQAWSLKKRSTLPTTGSNRKTNSKLTKSPRPTSQRRGL